MCKRIIVTPPQLESLQGDTLLRQRRVLKVSAASTSRRWLGKSWWARPHSYTYTSKLVYTLFFDNSMLADDAAREADRARRVTAFTTALQNMKILAEGGVLPPAPARGTAPGHLTTKLAALMPFGKVADFLSEVLPLSTGFHASTVCTRTLRVGKRLLRSPAAPTPQPTTSGAPVVIGLDGAYVRNRHPQPTRTFEVVVGQIRGAGAPATRFAFVRQGRAAGATTITQALRAHGVHQDTRITVLADGDAGWRAIQRAAAPEADPVLDWFHIAMRWQHVHRLATGAIHQGRTAEARTWLLDRIERATWALWNGQLSKTLGHLSDLRVSTWNARADVVAPAPPHAPQ
jgi:hypothetical protein